MSRWIRVSEPKPRRGNAPPADRRARRGINAARRSPISLRLSLASRYLASSDDFVSRTAALAMHRSCDSQALGVGHPAPNRDVVTRRQTALSSSRATPMSTCPVLRPRWCRQCMVLRTRDYCLPPRGSRRLSLSLRREFILSDHNYTNFGAQSRSLHPRYTRLHTLLHAGSLRTC